MDKQNIINNADEIVKTIIKLLNDKQYEEVLEYIDDTNNKDVLDNTFWELVPILVGYLTEENLNSSNDLFQTCKDVLNIIADKCNPAETVLVFLEQVENFDNDVRFQALLEPLARCLSTANLSHVIEWVISTIKAYVEGLPIPENEKLTVKKTSSEKTDPVVNRLTVIYCSIQSFLKRLTANNDVQTFKVKNYLISLYLCLFEKPFSHLNIGLENVCLYYPSIEQMCQLIDDPLNFLYIIENRCNKRIKKLIVDEDLESEQTWKVHLFNEISDLAYANYFTILMTSESLQSFIPQVYNPHYLMNTLFYLGNYLLKQPEYILVSKGLSLINIILQRIEIESIEHRAMELNVHTDLFSNLSQIMIYCDSEDERKLALEIFRNYVKRYNMRARHLVIIYLHEKSNHSGLLALVINILKESIIQSLEQTPHCEYFIGKKLEILLRKVCHLPHGSASDFLEISDEVIAALNLLRFLILRDKSNVTEIWNIINSIQDEYLKPLRVGIDLARAHWKVKTKELEEYKYKDLQKLNSEMSDNEITVTVGRQNLPPLSIVEKIRFCYQALNALDIMESIAIRVNECIENNYLQCK